MTKSNRHAYVVLLSSPVLRPTLALFLAFSLACDRPSTDSSFAPQTATAALPSAPLPAGDAQAHDPNNCSGPTECPPEDSDGDGLPDPDDKCPDVCELLNGVDDDDGCPDPNPGEAPEVLALVGPIEGLSFEYDKATIRAKSFPVLDQIVDVLTRHPDVLLEVQGHRDDDPSWEYRAIDISKRRAQSVREYLISKGIEANRLIAKSYGGSVPLVEGTSPKARAKNRRVELAIRNPQPRVADTCVRPPPTARSPDTKKL